MEKTTLLIAVIILSISAYAQEQIHLTGNSAVDFMGSPLLADASAKMKTPTVMEDILSESNAGKKSPWLAGLFSLAVPGAGELYSESYTKGAVFLGVEVTSWVIFGIYNHKGNEQTMWFKNYSDVHYSPVKYAQWVWRFIGSLSPGLDTSQYHIFRSSPDANNTPPFSSINWPELNRLEGEVNDFTHRLPSYGEQQYYELIGKYKQFSKGWDSEDPFDSDNLTPEEQFYFYGREFNLADKYYKIADLAISVIIANHIISAFDAYWTASRYNNPIHAEVRMKMQATAYGYLPMAEANIQYTF